jgi:hypothetical protein
MSDSRQTPHPPDQNNDLRNDAWRANRYPQIKQRGFYSDVASKENLDKIGVNNIFFES